MRNYKRRKFIGRLIGNLNRKCLEGRRRRRKDRYGERRRYNRYRN